MSPDPLGELATPEMKLIDFYNQAFKPLALRSRAANTLRLYNSTMNTFAKFLERSPRVADLTDDTVSRFLDWFKHLGRSPMSVNKERANLLAIWRFACRKHVLQQWPDVAAEREPKRTPQAWLEPDLAKLMAACRAAPGKIGRVPARSFWTALHLTMWDSGERISALMKLTWDLVDLADGYVRVPAEFRKAGTEDQLYRLRPETIAALKALRGSPDGPVFHWPFSPSYLWHRYKLLLKRAGLPHDSKSKFHRMRRSVASYAERAGGNATELLGHSSRKVTMAYLDKRLTGGRFASDILPSLASVDQIA
ncbi:MAG TPA: tyrosine-type recombinase/integrase, partial [Pirellulales bacterium]